MICCRGETSSFIPCCCTSLNCMNNYRVIDSGVDLRANSVRALIATCLNVSQKREVGFGLTYLLGSKV